MTQNEKLIISVCLLPVLADLLEDVELKHEVKMKQNTLLNSIRSFDRHFMNTADSEAIDQQINVQQWFRLQLKELVKELDLKE